MEGKNKRKTEDNKQEDKNGRQWKRKKRIIKERGWRKTARDNNYLNKPKTEKGTERKKAEEKQRKMKEYNEEK